MNQQVGWATMRALLVAASLALTLLAGCSGEVPMLTAKDTLPAADEAAALWADDAALAAVMTFELGDDIKSMIRQEMDAARESGELEEGDMSAEDEAMLDAMLSSHDKPGDGKAAFWAFVYQSEAKQSWFIAVVSADGIEHAEEMDMGWGGGQASVADGGEGQAPITDWRVDSDQAAAVAMGDESYRALAGDPQAMGVAALAMAEGTPYWVLVLVKLGWSDEDWEGDAMASSDGDVEDMEDSDWSEEEWAPSEAVVLVDARNGTMVPMDDMEAWGDVGPIVAGAQQQARELAMEFGSVSGELTAVAPDASLSFPVAQEGHGALVVAVEASNPLLAPIQVTVTDPEGLQTSFEVPMSLGLDSRQSVVLDIVPAGEWQVSLSLDPALRHTYTVEWCTDGVGIPSDPFGTSVQACSEVPSGPSSPAACVPFGAGSGVLDLVLGRGLAQ